MFLIAPATIASLHLTDTRAAAEAWLTSHRYSDAVSDLLSSAETSSITASE